MNSSNIGKRLFVPEVTKEEIDAYLALHKNDPCNHGKTISTCEDSLCTMQWWGWQNGWPLILQRVCCVEAAIDRRSIAEPACHGYCEECGELWLPAEADCPYCYTYGIEGFEV